MKPWRQLGFLRLRVPDILLQLGHGDEAVETEEAPADDDQAMALQLGHGDEAVETFVGITTELVAV